MPSGRRGSNKSSSHAKAAEDSSDVAKIVALAVLLLALGVGFFSKRGYTLPQKSSEVLEDVVIPARSWLGTELPLTTANRVRCCDVARKHVRDITPEDWDRVYNGQQPLILQGAMEGWPALRWTRDTFQTEPWFSHPVNLTQRSALDVCLDQIQIGIEVDWKHKLDKIQDYPTRGFTFLPPGTEPICGEILVALDKAELMHKEGKVADLEATIRSLVLNNTSPNRDSSSSLGAFASENDAAGGGDAYGTYLFLESTIFAQHPHLWEENVHPPAVLDPVDFTPHMEGTRASRRSLLMGRRGSRTSLHMDPYGETSWIAVITGKKAFRLWPQNASDHFYPVDGLHSGVRKTHIDTFGFVPPEATEYHSSTATEVVVHPGEIIVTMDWWHQAYNLEDSIAVTGNFVDRGNVKKVLKRAVEAENLPLAQGILALARERDPDMHQQLTDALEV